MKLLVIPDAHACPSYDNDRFTYLGHHIVAEQPDEIICVGDFADMPSLSSYDKGKRSFEGRRYRHDVEATIDAQEKLFAPLAQYNESRRKSGKAQYKPRTVMLLGNHDARIDVATNSTPELHQTIGVEDLQFSRFWSETWDFGEVYRQAGISFTHYFPSGRLGKAIGSVNQARAMLTKRHASCVAGHSHVLDYAEDISDSGAGRIFGLSVGNYGHADYNESWCKTTRAYWWNGVVHIDGAKDGWYESLRFVTQDALRRKYATP